MHPSITPLGLVAAATFTIAAAADVPTSIDRVTVDSEGRSAAELAAATDHRETWTTPRPVDPSALGAAGAAAGAASGAGGGAVASVEVGSDPEGDFPRDVVYSADGSLVFVVHRDSDNVTVFDTSTNTAIDTIAVGDFPVDLAVSGDGEHLVVTNVLSNDVSVIDVATLTVVATIPVTGEQPYTVETSADGRWAAVGVINDGVSSAVSIIDLDTLAETLSFPTAGQGVIGFFFTPEIGVAGNVFTDIALAPDGSVVIVPDAAGPRVVLHDRSTGAVVGDLAVADLPRALDVTADSTRAVVSHEGSARTLTVIDVPARSIIDTIATPDNLVNQVVAITDDATLALAAISNNLVIADLVAGEVTSTISTGTVGDIEITFDGAYAFVANFNARIIDLATQSLVRTIPVAPSYDSAVSPVERRAVALNNRFREDLHLFDVDGAGGFLESVAVSGEPAEGDVPSAVAMTPDGSVVVTGNLVSRNVSIIDPDLGETIAHVDVGDRVKDIAITDDGQTAVVCAMDSNLVVVVDVPSATVLAELPIFNRPGRVRLSPGGTEAYVLNVAGTDRISFIELDGADSSIVAQVPAGQTGVANGPLYTETSGIELSPDGSVLAVCDSFNDLLRLYDIAARAQVAAVPVGDFPLRVAFAPDGGRAYVVNHFSDDLTVVDISGPGSSAIATVDGMDRFPLTVSVSPDGSTVFVGTRTSGGGLDGLRLVDTSTNTLTGNLTTPGGSPRDDRPSMIEGAPGVLVATTGSELVRVTNDGGGWAILDRTALPAAPKDLAADAGGARVAVAQPATDTADLVRFVVQCDEDLGGDGEVGTTDLLQLLAAWGDCPIFGGCPEDLDGDGDVGTTDLLQLLAAWGPCG